MDGYRQVSLPESLYNEVQLYIGAGGTHASVADFIEFVVRREIFPGNEV